MSGTESESVSALAAVGTARGRAGAPETPARSIWTTLASDPVFRITLAILAVVLVPYVVPVLAPEQLEILADNYIDVVLLCLAIVAIRYRVDRDDRLEERRFWSYLTVGLGFWLAIRISYVALAEVQTTVAATLATDVFYLMFYVAVVLATETKPHLAAGRSSADLGYRFQSAGAITFATGFLVYFVLVPSNLNPEAYDTWLPSLYLYVTLDVYLMLRFTLLGLRCVTARWRVVYGLFALTAGLWAMTDLIECLSYAGVFAFRSGTALDLLWWCPIITIVLAARLRNHPFSQNRLADAERVHEASPGRSRAPSCFPRSRCRSCISASTRSASWTRKAGARANP